MVFSSASFIYMFLPAVFLIYLAIPHLKPKNYFLLAASFVFYSFGDPAAALIMTVSVPVNYTAGRLMAEEKRRKAVLAVSATVDIGILFVYKYLGYILSLAGFGGLFSLQLPLGISFFTFQALSYVIDCYRDKTLIRKNILDMALYIAFFPQLIAGPVVRYGDICRQIDSRVHTYEKTAAGIRRFCFGLAKKLIIANTMAKAADYTFSADPEKLTAFAAWTGAVCYTLQIYYDFSGYSDMAIGLGKMFGFEFRENFRYPYISASFTEFWHRWHISLSEWFKDYLYIPLGGNRKGKLRTIVNKWIVFLFTGIWHGANLTFLVWGIVHGFLLMTESLEERAAKKRFLPLRRAAVIIILIISFVIFRADDLSYAFAYIGRMFSAGGDFSVAAGLRLLMTPMFCAILGTAVIFSAPVSAAAEKMISAKSKAAAEYLSYIAAAAVFVISLLVLSEGGYDPFIYFRF